MQLRLQIISAKAAHQCDLGHSLVASFGDQHKPRGQCSREHWPTVVRNFQLIKTLPLWHVMRTENNGTRPSAAGIFCPQSMPAL
jgi:hypothetical protein